VTAAGAVPARPGTNADIASPYSFVVSASGVAPPAIRDADGAVVAPATLTAIPDRRQVVISVPRSAFAGLNLPSARYVVTAMSHADEGSEGVGGGAGEWTEDDPARDTDTSDPNVLDVFVPEGSDQTEVLDWTSGTPVDLPYVSLTLP
jgi:hypothetical protein